MEGERILLPGVVALDSRSSFMFVGSSRGQRLLYVSSVSGFVALLFLGRPTFDFGHKYEIFGYLWKTFGLLLAHRYSIHRSSV